MSLDLNQAANQVRLACRDHIAARNIGIDPDQLAQAKNRIWQQQQKIEPLREKRDELRVQFALTGDDKTLAALKRQQKALDDENFILLSIRQGVEAAQKKAKTPTTVPEHEAINQQVERLVRTAIAVEKQAIEITAKRPQRGSFMHQQQAANLGSAKTAISELSRLTKGDAKVEEALVQAGGVITEIEIGMRAAPDVMSIYRAA